MLNSNVSPIIPTGHPETYSVNNSQVNKQKMGKEDENQGKNPGLP